MLVADAVLSSDLACAGDGFTIPGSVDVTLDLNGHTVTGSGGGVGVQIVPELGDGLTAGHVRVANGTIRRFGTGVAVGTGAPGHHGIAEVRLERLVVRANDVGVTGGSAGGAPATTLADSVVADNRGEGVRLAFIRPFSLVNDEIRGNGGDGIFAFEDSLSLLQDSIVSRNGGAGARLSDTVAAVDGNTFLGNGGTGLAISERLCSAVAGYVVSDNVADRNGGGGMRMTPTGLCDPNIAAPPGTGNAAKLNAGFQCAFIVCARNRGLTRS